MALPGVKTVILDRFIDDFSGHHMVFISKKAMQSVRRIAATNDPDVSEIELEKLKKNIENMKKYNMIYPDPKIYPEMIKDQATSEYISEFTEWEIPL